MSTLEFIITKMIETFRERVLGFRRELVKKKSTIEASVKQDIILNPMVVIDQLMRMAYARKNTEEKKWFFDKTKGYTMLRAVQARLRYQR